MLNIKQGGNKDYFLSLWYDSTWDWIPVSPVHRQTLYPFGQIYFSFSYFQITRIMLDKSALQVRALSWTSFCFFLISTINVRSDLQAISSNWLAFNEKKLWPSSFCEKMHCHPEKWLPYYQTYFNYQKTVFFIKLFPNLSNNA